MKHLRDLYLFRTMKTVLGIHIEKDLIARQFFKVSSIRKSHYF